MDCTVAKHYDEANLDYPSSLKLFEIEKVMMTMRGGDGLIKTSSERNINKHTQQQDIKWTSEGNIMYSFDWSF